MRPSSRSLGSGVSNVVLIVFVTLKLTNTVNWSWVWVLSPLWITAVFALLLWTVFNVLIRRDRREIERRYSRLNNDLKL